MEAKVGWSAEVKPLFHSGKDDERILFFQSPLIWEEALAFPHLFLDRPRNLALLVFEVYMADVNALLERAVFLFLVSWCTAVDIACFLESPPQGALNYALSSSFRVRRRFL